MNLKQIDRKIYERLHSLAISIDPIRLIGEFVVEVENRPLTKKELQDVGKRYNKILKELQKKSKLSKE